MEDRMYCPYCAEETDELLEPGGHEIVCSRCGKTFDCYVTPEFMFSTQRI